MAYLIENKEWLFSGVGIFIIAWIVKFFFRRRQTTLSQTARSGSKSINIQAGRDISLQSNVKNGDVEKE